jgi:hypothetical protein
LKPTLAYRDLEVDPGKKPVKARLKYLEAALPRGVIHRFLRAGTWQFVAPNVAHSELTRRDGRKSPITH